MFILSEKDRLEFVQARAPLLSQPTTHSGSIHQTNFYMHLAETADSGLSGGRDQETVFALGRATRALLLLLLLLLHIPLGLGEGKNSFHRRGASKVCGCVRICRGVAREYLGSASPKPGRIRQTSVNLGK